MRLSGVQARDLGLLLVVVAMAMGLFYLWSQAQSASADLADARVRLAALEVYAGDERLQEAEDELEQARDITLPSPFPTREDVMRRVAALRETVSGSGVLLTSFTLGETSATPGGILLEVEEEERRETYPGVVLGLGALGSSDALLTLLEKMQEQLSGAVLQQVMLFAQEEGGLRLFVKAALYHQK